MRRHKRQFTGDLAKPLYQSNETKEFIGLPIQKGPSPALLRGFAHIQIVSDRSRERLGLLLDLYGIPRDHMEKWECLALALARDYVPGFRTQGSPGAKKKWGKYEMMRLHAKVAELVATGVSAMEACRILHAAPNPDPGFPLPQSVMTLYRQYQKAKSSGR